MPHLSKYLPKTTKAHLDDIPPALAECLAAQLAEPIFGISALRVKKEFWDSAEAQEDAELVERNGKRLLIPNFKTRITLPTGKKVLVPRHPEIWDKFIRAPDYSAAKINDPMTHNFIGQLGNVEVSNGERIVMAGPAC